MKLLIITSSLLITLSASAQGPANGSVTRTMNRILKDTTTMVALDLNEKTVFCTLRGYGFNTLKISVPDLAHLAHFDHRVAQETLPCMQSGACVDSNTPNGIIKADEPYSIVPIRIRLIQNITLNDTAETCEVHLSENVTGLIRNHVFTHFMQDLPKPMDYEKCLRLAPL